MYMQPFTQLSHSNKVWKNAVLNFSPILHNMATVFAFHLNCQLIGPVDKEMYLSLYQEPMNFFVIGACVSDDIDVFPKNYILYQTEQDEFVSENNTYKLWTENARFIFNYNDMGHGFYLPFMFSPCLLPQVPWKEDRYVDILFLMSMSKRRFPIYSAICDDLKDYRIVFANITDDLETSNLLLSTKIIVNIHAYKSVCPMETSRVSHAIAHKVLVVSEQVEEMGVWNELVEFVPPNNPKLITKRCLKYLNDPDEREKWTSNAFIRFTNDKRYQIPVTELKVMMSIDYEFDRDAYKNTSYLSQTYIF